MEGFKTFAGNILAELKQAAFNWLFKKLGKLVGGLPKVPATLDLASITLFFLELAGLTWANIAKQIQRRLPKQAKPAWLATKLVGNPPTIGKVEDALKQFNSEWADVAEHLSWNSIYMYLTDTLPGKVAEWGKARCWNWRSW